MQDAVVIHEWQKVTSGDLNAMSTNPRKSFDDLLADLGPGTAFTGFNVSETTNTSVTVSSGRLYTALGPVYYNADVGGNALDLLDQLPQTTRRYVAVGVFGEQKDTDIQPRTFLSDAETRVAVGRDVPTRNTRRANIALIYTAAEGPDPDRPQETAGTTIVAYILLDTSGIVEIEPVTSKRAPSLRTHEARLNENDGWRLRTGTRLDTLGTDIASLANSVKNTASQAFVLMLAADLARAKEKLNIPSTYAAYGSDHYLVVDQSDTANVDYLAKVEEGIRFPPAAERVAQLGLINTLNPLVNVQNNFLLPAFDEAARLSVLGNDGEISVSQYQFQNITWTYIQKTRTRLRYGTPFFACTNGWWWYDATGSSYATSTTRGAGNNFVGGMTPGVDLIYDPIANIYRRPSTGETFKILGSETDAPNHTVLRLEQFWEDQIDESYWNRTETTEGLNGSVISQTFLNTQGGWLTSVELPFTRVADTGDVHVLICQTDKGEPDFDRAIASSTVAATDLKKLPDLTKFKFAPIYLEKGGRYAIVIQTPGNHFLSVVKNNKFAQGSMFQSSDFASQLVNIDTDIAFQLNFAKFRQPRVEVDLLGIELNGGIAAIDMNFDSIKPDQAIIEFQVRVGSNWVTIGPNDVNALNALPPLLAMRAVLTGTTDEMPGFGVGPNSTVLTSRPRPDFRHISKAYIPGGTVSTVYVDIRLEAWRGSPYHTHTCKLLTGAGYATVVNPTLVSETVAPDDPKAIVRRYAFTGLSITGFKIRQEGLTDNVLSTFHVADRVYIALT